MLFFNLKCGSCWLFESFLYLFDYEFLCKCSGGRCIEWKKMLKALLDPQFIVLINICPYVLYKKDATNSPPMQNTYFDIF